MLEHKIQILKAAVLSNVMVITKMFVIQTLLTYGAVTYILQNWKKAGHH